MVDFGVILGKHPPGYQFNMSLLIAALTTGAGVVTQAAGQSQCDEFIVIGDVDTALPISGLSIEIGGKSFINITGVQTLLTAWAKWKMKAIQGSAVVGMVLRVATGRILKNTTYKFTNGGATTPPVYVYSDNDNGIPIEAATNQINASSNQTYTKFGMLAIQTPANVTSYDVTWRNGYNATLSTVEMDAYLAMQYDSEANGQMGGVTVIDNSDQKFQSIRINVSANTVVLTVRLPQESFDLLNQAA